MKGMVGMTITAKLLLFLLLFIAPIVVLARFLHDQILTMVGRFFQRIKSKFRR